MDQFKEFMRVKEYFRDDFNGHVGKASGGYKIVHRIYGFGERNEVEEVILEFTMAYDLS